MNMRPIKKRDLPIPEEIERDLYGMLYSTGKLLPLTEEEVIRAEKKFEEAKKRGDFNDDFTIPPPDYRRQSSLVQKIKTLQSPYVKQVEDELAWAARSGGQISLEVQERMRRDRDRVDRQIIDGKNQK